MEEHVAHFQKNSWFCTIKHKFHCFTSQLVYIQHYQRHVINVWYNKAALV